MTTVQGEMPSQDALEDGISLPPSRATGSFGLQHFLRVELGIAVAVLAVCSFVALGFIAIAWLKFSWFWGICFSFFTVLGVAWTVRMIYPARDYPRRWVAFRVSRKLPPDAEEWEPDAFPDPNGDRQWTNSTANDLPDRLTRAVVREDESSGPFIGVAMLCVVGLAVFASHYLNVLLAIPLAFLIGVGIVFGCSALRPRSGEKRTAALMEALRASADPLCQGAVAAMEKRFHERVAAKRMSRAGAAEATDFAVVIPSEVVMVDSQPKALYNVLKRPRVCANCGIQASPYAGDEVVMHTTRHDILGASHQTTQLPTCFWCRGTARFRCFFINVDGKPHDVITHVHPRFIDKLVKFNPNKGCRKAGVLSKDSPPKIQVVS